MKEITIIVISCDRAQDKLMHVVDLFEPSKRLGEILTLSLTVNDKFDAKTGIIAIKESLEKIGRFVSSAFIPGDSNSAYIDQSVRLISFGDKFTTLDKILTGFGIKRHEH